MSEEIETTEEAPKTIVITDPDTGKDVEHQIDEDGNPFVQHEGFRNVLKGFGGEKKGLSYYVREFDSLEDAAKVFSADVILNCLNSELGTTVKRRVISAKIPAFEDKSATKLAIEKLKVDTPLVFTMAEANALVPGERERTMTTIEREMKEARKNGKLEDLQSLLGEYMSMLDKKREASGISEDEEDED